MDGLKDPPTWLKVATTQEIDLQPWAPRQWTSTTTRLRCGLILLPSLTLRSPHPQGEYADPDLCRLMASLGHHVLTYWGQNKMTGSRKPTCIVRLLESLLRLLMSCHGLGLSLGWILLMTRVRGGCMTGGLAEWGGCQPWDDTGWGEMKVVMLTLKPLDIFFFNVILFSNIVHINVIFLYEAGRINI